MAEVEAVVAAKGKLPVNEILRCRVRYFTDGAILGSRAFVEDQFRKHRSHFGIRRESGSRPMAGVEWGDLYAARDLRVNVYGRPTPAPA